MPSEVTKGARSVEADLVTRALRRDEDAVRAIIQQNNRRLFRLARSIVKDDNEAEDIVQECYLRAFAGLSEFRGEAQLSTWLTRIVINEAYGRLRRRRVTTDLASIEATGWTPKSFRSRSRRRGDRAAARRLNFRNLSRRPASNGGASMRPARPQQGDSHDVYQSGRHGRRTRDCPLAPLRNDG